MLFTTECAYGPPASVYTVTIQTNNLSYSMQIANAGEEQRAIRHYMCASAIIEVLK